MKAQAQTLVSDFQSGLELTYHIWWQDRGCALFAVGGKRGKVPFPCILCCGQPHAAVSLQEAAVGSAKNTHMCTQTPRHRGMLWEVSESEWIWASIAYSRPA